MNEKFNRGITSNAEVKNKDLWLLTIVTDEKENTFMTFKFETLKELMAFVELNDRHNSDSSFYEIEKVTL